MQYSNTIPATRILSWLTLASFIFILTAGYATAIAAPQQDPLAQQRWQDEAYGLSLRPPAQASEFPGTGDDIAVRFKVGESYQIKVAIQHTEDPVELAELKKRGITKFAFVQPSASILTEEQLTLAGRPAVRVIYQVPGKVQPWILSQTLMQIDPTIFAVFEIEADKPVYDANRDVFQAVFDSVQLADPQELNRMREAQLAAGQAWLNTFNIKQLKAMAPPERWLRVIKDGKDVGYTRIQSSDAKMLGESGLRIKIQARITTGDSSFDTISDFFRSDNDRTEVWEIRTTKRNADKAPGLPSNAPKQPALTWVETGLRTGGEISVNRESPTRVDLAVGGEALTKIDDVKWTTPPTAYVSQADLHVIYSLLPADRPQTLAFYAYHPAAHKLVLRTLRVEPLASGSYRVHERVPPTFKPQVSTYNASGQLVQRVLGDGSLIMPATADQIKQIWDAR